MTLKHVEAVCCEAYRKTRDYYANLSQRMVRSDYGFKILYGPPKIKPDVLFLGLNPGGNENDAQQGKSAGERDCWTKANEYISKDYRLATHIQKIWHRDQLENSVALNRLFFRSPNINAWKTNSLEQSIRCDAEKFCLDECQKIVKAMEPKSLIIIGLSTLSQKEFIKTNIAVGSPSRRVVQNGTLWGIPTSAVIHLSGQWGANDGDISKMRTYFEVRV